MARRRENDTATQSEPEVTPEVTEEQTTESPVEPTEQVAEGDGNVTPQASEAKPAEEKVDLGPFQTAVREAVAKRDASGELPADAYGPVNAAYADVKGAKAKNQAKAWLAEQMGNLINEAPLKGADGMALVFEARALHLIQGQLTASGGTKEPADPTEAYVERVVSIGLAQRLVTSTQPDGIAEDWAQRAETLASSEQVTSGIEQYRTWLNDTSETKGEAPQVPQVVVNAFKLAQGKAASQRKSGGTGRTGTPHEGPNRSVPKHMAEYFADKPIGHEASVAEIAKFDSVEYGSGADHPSSGAVTARLKPKSGKVTLEGIEPCMVNGHLGARKTA